MKHLSLILILLLGTVGCGQETEKPVTEEPSDEIVDKLLQKSEDEILDAVAKLPDEEIDLGLVALVLTKGFYPDIDIKEYLKQLDEMSEEIKQLIGDEKDPEKIIQIINKYLFETKGFKNPFSLSDPWEKQINLSSLNRVLDTRQGSCLGLSILYLVLGEKLNLPLYLVPIHSHYFVRWDDKSFIRNIEATNKGEKYSNNYYPTWIEQITRIKLSDKDFDCSRMLANLSKKELFASLLFSRASGYIKEKEKVRAKKDVEKALRLVSRSGASGFQLLIIAQRCRDKKHYDEALSYCNKAIDIMPDYPRSYYLRGDIYSEDKGNLEKAIPDISKAIKLDPKASSLYQARGRLYNKKNDYDKALRDFDKAIELNPGAFSSHFGRAVILRKKKEYDKSLESINKVIELNPAYPQAYYVKGLIYKETNRLSEAIKDFKKYIELEPGTSRAEKAENYIKELQEELGEQRDKEEK